jgi:hypothetical protein
MNVSLPFDKHPYAFFGLLVLMVVMVAGMAYGLSRLFRTRKWL